MININDKNIVVKYNKDLTIENNKTIRQHTGFYKFSNAEITDVIPTKDGVILFSGCCGAIRHVVSSTYMYAFIPHHYIKDTYDDVEYGLQLLETYVKFLNKARYKGIKVTENFATFDYSTNPSSKPSALNNAPYKDEKWVVIQFPLSTFSNGYYRLSAFSLIRNFYSPHTNRFAEAVLNLKRINPTASDSTCLQVAAFATDAVGINNLQDLTKILDPTNPIVPNLEYFYSDRNFLDRYYYCYIPPKEWNNRLPNLNSVLSLVFPLMTQVPATRTSENVLELRQLAKQGKIKEFIKKANKFNKYAPLKWKLKLIM